MSKIEELQNLLHTIKGVKRGDFTEPDEVRAYWEYILQLENTLRKLIDGYSEPLPSLGKIKIDIEDDEEEEYRIYEEVYLSNGFFHTQHLIATIAYPEYTDDKVVVDWKDDSFKENPQVLALINKVFDLDKKRIDENIQDIIRDFAE